VYEKLDMQRKANVREGKCIYELVNVHAAAA